MSDARDDEEIARAILQIVKTDVRRLKSSYHAAADSHGSLDRDGIMEWLPTFGLPTDITPAAAGEFYDLLIEEADANNDGLLQWGEFLLGLRKVGTKDQLRWSWATPGVESKSAETAFNPDAFALKLGQQQPSLAPAPALDSHRFNRALRAAGGAVDGAASLGSRAPPARAPAGSPAPARRSAAGSTPCPGSRARSGGRTSGGRTAPRSLWPTDGPRPSTRVREPSTFSM